MLFPALQANSHFTASSITNRDSKENAEIQSTYHHFDEDEEFRFTRVYQNPLGSPGPKVPKQLKPGYSSIVPQSHPLEVINNDLSTVKKCAVVTPTDNTKSNIKKRPQRLKSLKKLRSKLSTECFGGFHGLDLSPDSIITSERFWKRRPAVDTSATTSEKNIFVFENTIQKQFAKETPLDRFRHAARLVLVLLRATVSTRRDHDRSEAKLLSFAQLQSELTSQRAGHGSDLAFDPNLFKANKKMQISYDAMMILRKHPEYRSDAELHIALVALNQMVDAFGEFPINMQESLVRVGWYEKVAAKRVIIRQGHKADNFYFILSGTAVVTILETDSRTGESYVRTAAFLKKGNSFGELALMHGACRSATVTCQDDVELLAVGRRDFIDIFMPVTTDKEPEHIQFLRTVEILNLWPFDVLPYDDPKICLFTYFRRGVVMCKDSNRSEWIYVVKTGSCRVLKSLKATQASIRSVSTRDSYLPDVNSNKTRKISSRRKTKSNQSLTHKIWDSSQKLHKCHSFPTENVKKSKYKDLPQAKHLPPIRKREEKELRNSAEDHMQTIEAVYEKMHSKKVTITTVEKGKDTDKEKERTQPTETVFVQIQKLGSKDNFGLVHVAFEMTGNSTSVSLVSDGAECILINRKFFLQYLSDYMTKQLRKTIQPYPTEESLQQQLEEKANWQEYKVKTVKDFIYHSKHFQDSLHY